MEMLTGIEALERRVERLEKNERETRQILSDMLHEVAAILNEIQEDPSTDKIFDAIWKLREKKDE